MTLSGWLKWQKMVSHAAGGWKPKVTVSGLVFPEALPLGLQMAIFCVLTWPLSLYARILSVFCTSYEDMRLTGLGSHLCVYLTFLLSLSIVTLGVKTS